MEEHELLFNEIYEKTKDCGRTQFVRLIMDLQRENMQLKEKLENNTKIQVSDHKYASQKEDEVIVLQQKIQKAIEYIDNTSIYNNEDGKVWLCECVGVDGILEILESSDK